MKLARWKESLSGAIRTLAPVRASRFFPHGLFAVLVGLYGVRNVLPILEQVRLIRDHLKSFGPAEDFAHLPPILFLSGGIPQTAIGLLQIIVSIGLLLRSRFAWFLTLLLSTLSILVIFHKTPLSFSHLALNVLLILGLLATRKSFDRSSLTTGTFFSVASLLILTGYASFGSLVMGKGFSPPITSLVTALYFSVMTLATVGYGDIVPKTDDARLFVVSLVLFGITVFSAAISSVLIPLANERLRKIFTQEKKTMPRENHYILVGTSSLARSVYRELSARQLPVTLILPRKVDDPPFDQADQVIGDPADGKILEEAGAKKARAILSLLEEDAENAFVVLATREIGSKAKTVVSVRDRVNFSRIRSVSPDMILSPEVIGGELIAMALNNEKIDESFFRKALFLDSRMNPLTEKGPSPPDPS